jgi:nickel superoxide dismutase
VGKKKMMRKKFIKKRTILGILVLVTVFASLVYSHCQIPCGIYNDPARFDMIAEHITTIEKSIQQITALSKQDQPNMNQLVRWVQNKETHADQLSEIVTYYFMAQRVKPVDKTQRKAHEDYVKKITLLHEMLVYSMKAKQTTDLSNVEQLKILLTKFKSIYLQEHSH